ncbi:hypothetical protein RND71_034575 [Anisodus tanguticus]|uniref:Rapid ALkalinization Factor n=1 Tax=Anisodus tanguticus TaxID=243964 RepID=A0AAE1V2R3_9SOLA|nr:hypothetical protein RND71_034574 [Anisodus tanguticus]KAK4348236.1 hypothetical protein RND71_034575 [Anisodus tanguticus]
MATSRAVIVVVIIAITLLAEISEGKEIGYGAIGGNGIPCSRKNKNMNNCHEGKPANPYTRGCEETNRCRNGKEPPHKESLH